MNQARASDLYRSLTYDHSKELTRTEFLMAMVRIGYEGEPDMLKQLFEDIDLDDSGVLGIDELCAQAS